MDDVVVGIFALLIGIGLTLAGYSALRVLIALLGAFTGFVLGAALVSGITGSGFLGTFATWVAGVLGAILLGALAYAFYQVAVLIGLASIGFAIGAGIMGLLGVEQPWLVWVVGAVMAAVLVVIGMAGDLPAMLLILLTALAGAELVVSGVMLLMGVIDIAGIEDGAVPTVDWWWSVLVLGIAASGMVIQYRGVRRSRARMREQWDGQRPAS